MKGREWLQAIEEFLYDGRKKERNSYNQIIRFKKYPYVVPVHNGLEWSIFAFMMLETEKDQSAETVYQYTKSCSLSIHEEILKWLERKKR